MTYWIRHCNVCVGGSPPEDLKDRELGGDSGCRHLLSPTATDTWMGGVFVSTGEVTVNKITWMILVLRQVILGSKGHVESTEKEAGYFPLVKWKQQESAKAA